MGETVRGDVGLAMEASLLAPWARTFSTGVNGNSQGQQSTWAAHPDLTKALAPPRPTAAVVHGCEEGWRVVC